MYTPTFGALKAINGSLFAAAFIIVCGRFAIRLRKVGQFQADDYFMLLSLVCLTIFVSLILEYLPDLEIVVTEPLKITLPRLHKISVYNVTLTLIGKAILISVQATFLSLYWMVFSVSKRFRIFWFAVAGWAVLAFLISFMTSFFICGKPTDIANPLVCNVYFGGKYDQNIFILIGVLNVSVELAVICLPIGMLRTLEMGAVQKGGLAFVFTLGFLTIVFDLIRTITATSPATSKNVNIAFMWASLEPFAAIIVAALPTYYSLFQIGKPSTKNRYYDELDRSSNMQHSQSGLGGSRARSGKGGERDSPLKRDELELKLIDRQPRTIEV